ADGPPPLPRAALIPAPSDPGPQARMDTLSEGTRGRLAAASTPTASEPGRDARSAVSLTLAGAALAAGWRLFGGDRG
ncbi:MAG: hypothetical protein ACLFV0_05930, partial [Nitriliruptoraceae bacterium]